MLIVTEQNGIDRSHLLGRQGGVGSLCKPDMRQLVLAGRIKCRIGEQPEAVKLRLETAWPCRDRRDQEYVDAANHRWAHLVAASEPAWP